MTSSDPMIRDLKVYTGNFLKYYDRKQTIDDTNASLIPFLVCMENILRNGLQPLINTFGFSRQNDAWTWMSKIANAKYEVIHHSYTGSVENVESCPNIYTNQGRLRLLMRHCLARKCLHVPVEYIISTGENFKIYRIDSILGDEILSEILLSVLYQCSELNFKLDLENTSFLDLSWLLPKSTKVELVPTKNLGIAISFAREKAIIVDIKSNSVCSESKLIAVGDVLGKLNGTCIHSGTKGRLSTILKSRKGPVVLEIIKAINPDTQEYYPPIIKLFKEIDLDPAMVKHRSSEKSEATDEVARKLALGFKCIYLGHVESRTGDVKQIDRAFNILSCPNSGYYCARSKKCKMNVLFDVGEMGVKCVDKNNKLIMKHSFMEISACGTVMSMPHYFSYVAGDEYCNVAKNFKCHIFMAENEEAAYTILKGIGQGFHRTHYVV